MTEKRADIVQRVKSRMRAALWPIAREFAVISLFVVAAIVMTWPLLPEARTRIVDVGVDDTLLYTRYARCFHDWLLGRAPGYLSFDMYFPNLLSGATDDAALGIAVQALPLAFFIRDYLLIINLVTFASFVMCAHATYLLTRQLTSSRGAGIVGGFAFAFCLYRIRQLEHPHVLQMQWLPYALYFMHRLAEAPTRRNGILFTIFLFFACTASFNVAIYSAFVFPTVGTWLILSTKNRRFALAGWLAFAATVVGLSLLVVYEPFFILRDIGAPVRDVAEVQAFSSMFESFYAAPAFSKNYGDLSGNMTDECATFLGWVVLVLASFGSFGPLLIATGKPLRRSRQRFLVPVYVALAAIMAGALLINAARALYGARLPTILMAILVIVVFAYQLFSAWRRVRISAAPLYLTLALFYAALCLGPYLFVKRQPIAPGLWQYVQWIPGFEQVRTPGRLFFVTSLCAAILAGIGARAIAQMLPGRISRALWYVVAGLMVLWDLRTDSIPTREMPTIETAPPVYAVLARTPKPGAVVEFPVEWNQRQRELVYFANIHQRPTVNGISAWGMAYLNMTMYRAWLPDPASDDPHRNTGLDALRAEHVAGLRYAIIHTGWTTDLEHATYIHGLLSLGASPIGSYEGEELFELPDPPPSRPPTARDVDVRFDKVDWRQRADRDLLVTLTFMNHTNENLYEKTVKHFTVTATDRGEVVGKGNGYLLPPLFIANGEAPASFRIKLGSRAAVDAADITIVDDDGATWGKARMKLPE